MRQFTFRSILSSVAFAVLTSTASAQEIVNVYNWSDYIDENILEEFTAETGIEVVYDVFDSNEVLETKLLSGKSGYDVVVPSATFLSRQIQAGVFQKLDKSKLTNKGNMWGLIEDLLKDYDPNNAYSVNYMWGTTGIGYNVDMVKERLGIDKVDSWDIFFKPENLSKLADCGVHSLDGVEEVMPIVMNYIGENPNETDPEKYTKAIETWMAVRPYISKFNSSEYISALANGDICIAIGWSGDVLQSRDRAAEADNGVTVEYIAPKEGTMMWFDQMAIPADADNAENAHSFINYIMRADVMAKASNYVYFANGNEASQPLLNDDVINDTAIYPDEAALETLFITQPYSPKLSRKMNRAWTRIKSGQ